MDAEKKIEPAQYRALAEFRYALRCFLRFSEKAAEAAGVTAQQHQALLAIKGFPDKCTINIGELAERLQIVHHSAVGLVDRLVAEKYVRRVPGSEDRRKVYLELTKQGEAVLQKLSAAHKQQLQRIGPQITQILHELKSEL